MTFEELKNGLMGKHVAYIKQGGRVMANFVIDEVDDTHGVDKLTFYGDDEDGGRHHFPLSYEQAEELITNGDLTVYWRFLWHPTRKSKAHWRLIISDN